MLVTKLKNKIKSAYILIFIIVFLAATSVTSRYGEWYYGSDAEREQEYMETVTSSAFLKRFVEMTYILNNYQANNPDTENALKQKFEEMMKGFDEFYPYADYAVFDENDEKIESMSSGEIFSTSAESLMQYQTAVVIRYYNTGIPFVQVVQGEYKDEQTTVLKDIINVGNEIQRDHEVKVYDEYGNDKVQKLTVPKNRTYIIAMTDENQQMYLESRWGLVDEHAPDSMGQWLLVVSTIVAAFAWILPLMKKLQTGNEKVFMIPFEIAGIVVICVIEIATAFCWQRIINYGNASVQDMIVWMFVFLIVYWTSGILRPIYELGVRRYMKERTIVGAYGNKMKEFFAKMWHRIKTWFKDTYQSLEKIDVTQKNDKVILKLVVANFLILCLICMLWMFGIMALVVYSVVLFFLLRKFYNNIQQKYAVLLYATNEIAEGNLNREINEDLGIFNPFKNEITKIQDGFKNAVDKEVKSQRMKTELITNVSHDLKTPLTAIITYVNLLKEEQDEEKRREYIDVLDKKSHRLKVLIDDLFEVSKASSRNVTLHIMDVDMVSLFKQVKLETEEKFAETGLDFRCHYPDEPVIVPLDSQKTYRVFENLLINAAKYAMPNTRIYVDILCEGNVAVFRMKNISAAELNFDVSEITERFVRGDESRNTEGSGLGLAIVKSFTELQKGEFKIETDGDLFKVEVRFEQKSQNSSKVV